MKNSSPFTLVRRVYALLLPLGCRRILTVLALIMLQGLAQVVGVSSIFPFLSIATDPAEFRSSQLAAWLPIDAVSDRSLLLWSGCGCIAALLLANMVSLAAMVILARYVHGVATYLRKRLLAEVMAQPYDFFLRTSSSEIYQRIQVDVQQFANLFLLPFLTMTASGLTVCLMVLAVTVTQPAAALITICVLAAFYGVIFAFVRPHARRLGESARASNMGMILTLQEAITNIKTVITFDKTSFVERSYALKSDRIARLMPWAAVFGQGPKFIIEPIGLGGLVAVMTIAALAEGSLATALPSLGVLALTAYRLLPEAQKIYSQASSMMTYRHVLAKMERVGNTTTSAGARDSLSIPMTFTGAITFESVTFKYLKARAPVLKNVSARILSNTTVGISGPSGSGKSTFVDLILGLHVPCEGAIRIDGQPLTVERLPAWRAIVAYVPQEVHMFDDTLAANIAFGVAPADVDHVRLREAAQAAQLLQFIESDLPDGFESIVGERGARLSGGQRQRIGLARALYRRPQILILDEATSALDYDTENMVMEALQQLHGKLTMIVIAHRLETLEMCDVRMTFPLGIPAAGSGGCGAKP